MQPLLSIVIANFNYGRFLEEAIHSVINQDMGESIELIICDAASADNSVEIIKKYAEGLPANTPYEEWCKTSSQTKKNKAPLITWWCSEKDGGQSAAFNKGFAHAKGKFLTWLNADDVLMPDACKKLEQQIRTHPDCEWFVGGVIWLTKDMRVIKCGRGRSFSRLRATSGEVGVWGPSSVFSKSLYERAGKVDERFFYTMDSDLWYRFYFKAHAIYRPFATYAWGLRLHEMAKMSAHNFAESGQSAQDHPKWKRIAQEKEWMHETARPNIRPGLFNRVFSVRLLPALLSRIDTIRYAGKDYKEVFK
jgi:glycosyltransferase involved in cell wall biosynthesis